MGALTIFLLALAGSQVINGGIIPTVQTIQASNFSGSEEFGDTSKFKLSWYINENEKAIYFNVTADTTGFVGFGVGPYGLMYAADIFIAGVDPEGNPYGLDYHGVGATYPVVDESQDWILDYANETDRQTHLSFHRLLNTCDDGYDLPITDTTMRVIWSMGVRNDLAYHNTRGSQSVNFYRGNTDSGFREEDFDKLELIQEIDMPEDRHTNWCTIHELPDFGEKRHIVAFEPVLESIDARRHTYYFILHRCVAQSGQDPEAFFKPWTTHPGDHCYGGGRNESFPFEKYCSGNVVYSWGGEGRMVFPDNIGLPISEDPNVREYFALEIYYNNGFGDAGKKFKTGGRIYHTNQLRENEAGLMLVQHTNRVQLTIPHESYNFVVAGHCSGECTQNLLPENGITAFNVLLGAHYHALNIRLRHFRGDQELEWVDTEDYFNFAFQQNKQLSKSKKIERGDQLTVECSYDTMEQFDPSAVVGGLGTDNEKCQAWIYYWPKVDLTSCESAQDLDEHFKGLGFTEWKEVEGAPGTLDDYEIVAPENLVGRYLESVTRLVNWPVDFRAEYEEKKRYGDQVAVCTGESGKNIKMASTVKYPENLKEYQPVNECRSETNPAATTQAGVLVKS